MTRKIRTLALTAALLATATGSAFASSPGGTNPVPPTKGTTTTVIEALISLLGL
ncbi:MAG: hypothetical protein QOH85_1335 [Acidobacteriaceae bacterium]|jgi:hypothetical protein|nr:hypothetical protein [Acidobacteriaceae bacterium]